MKKFVIYDLATGKIKRCGICVASDFDSQPLEGEGIIEHARVNDTEYKVDLETLEIVPV
jgi:hypothetical protein